MFSVRPATELDAAAIAHVHIQSWRTTYAGIVSEACLASLNETERVSLWREWLTQDITVFVAEIDGTIVGFASSGPAREPQEAFEAELYAMYLLEEAQRQGIGTALLKATARAMMSRGLHGLMAWVLVANAATHFYARMGAHPIVRKEIQMGEALLPEVEYAWTRLEDMVR